MFASLPRETCAEDLLYFNNFLRVGSRMSLRILQYASGKTMNFSPRGVESEVLTSMIISLMVFAEIERDHAGFKLRQKSVS